MTSVTFTGRSTAMAANRTKRWLAKAQGVMVLAIPHHGDAFPRHAMGRPADPAVVARWEALSAEEIEWRARAATRALPTLDPPARATS